MTAPPVQDTRFAEWLDDLERRHLSDLKFSEVSRALRALSSTYVERRARLGQGAALTGAGKRAAFALFYGPLHFLLVRTIVESIPCATGGFSTLVDLGCGTGAAGAGWATACDRPPDVVAFDRNPWALAEARLTYRRFGLRARAVQADVVRSPLPGTPAAFLAAFTLNELDDGGRDALMNRLLERGGRGNRVLVVEPVARRISPWWDRLSDRVLAAGGRVDEWRFRIDRPAIVEKLDRAAGLDHRELTGRSMFIGPIDPTPTRPSSGGGEPATC